MNEDFQKQVLEELKGLNEKFTGINNRVDRMKLNMATKGDISNLEIGIQLLADGQNGLRNEMNDRFTEMAKRFTGLEDQVRKIHEQTRSG